MTDDRLVFGKTVDEHHMNLLSALTRLEESGLTQNMEKSEFYKEEITNFGLGFTSKGF